MTLQDQGRSISQKLSNLAKKRGTTYQNVATEFLIERLLVRLLQHSTLSKSLIFKGGYVALKVYRSSRYTVDLDALLKGADQRKTLDLARKAAESDIGDAVWFHFESEVDLQTQGEYGGVRLSFRAGIGEPIKDLKRAQIIELDIGIGDAVVPGPVEMHTPSLLGGEPISWQVYPLETMIAEKLHTLVVRGSGNSRAKDIFDLWTFLPNARGPVLREALAKTFAHRGDALPSDLLATLGEVDLALRLKHGWKNAVQDIDNAPTCDEAFQSVLQHLKRLLA